MICGMTYYQLCWYFLFYSFIGWVVEVVYHAVTLGKVVNRGFLNGPVCPVYGFGVVSVFAVVNLFDASGHPLGDLGLFAFGITLATLVELIGGWGLDRFFHARWWDYSDRPFNFHGYICLEFSLIWGLAIMMVMRIFQKYVAAQVQTEASCWGWLLIALLYAVYLTDLIVTVAILQGFNRKLTQLDALQADLRIVSDKLSSGLGGKTIETAQVIGEGRVQAALAKAELRDAIADKRQELAGAGAARKAETLEELKARKAALQQEYEKLAASLTAKKFFGLGRVLSAFPDMKHRKYPEIIRLLKERMK